MTVGRRCLAYSHGPLKYSAFEGGPGSQHLVDPVVYPLKDLGYADLNCRVEFLEILHEFVDTFGISADNAEVQGCIDGHSLKHMGQGKKGDAEIAFFVMMHLCGIDGRMVKIGVGNHGPFG